MLKLRLVLIVIVATISVVLMSQSEAINVSQIDSLKKQFLPAEYRNTNFTFEDLKRVFKEKCKKASGVDNSTLYQEVEKEALKFSKCLSGIANLTALQEEIEVARPIGELDTVFHKYCLKAPEGEKCFKEFNTAVQPCLSKDEKAQNAIMVRIFTGLLSFMCARGGDQIALFVAEEGPECFEANKEAITHCANKSFSEFVPKDNSVPDLFNLPDFVVEPEHCIDLVKFETCTLHHLEQCQEITPANVAESVFKFIKNETSCKSWLENKANERSILKDPKKSSASITHLSILSCLLAAFVGLSSRYFA
ncbi:27 kDa hemolymph protein-like [Lucilia cuprina]|uniref:27 kDa hemolymph protein-like n=1 Tax=Lucilia cuprina TaxID=7375 RepID=UPI001F05A30A|nr:27 kDa hemolymph protein-like [Lucilia cuprina]